MSLDHAILGFLNYQPQSGYDLKKIFDTSVQHFWRADQSQIYRTLSRLVENGYAEMEPVQQEDRPDRKVYSITALGQDELRSWIINPPPMGAPRSAPLIQVFFSGQLSDSEILDKFDSYAKMMKAVLAEYDGVPNQIGPYLEKIKSPRDHYFWMLTLDNGIRNMKANLEWAESVIENIQNGNIPQR